MPVPLTVKHALQPRMALHRDPRLLQLLHQGLVICLEQVRVYGSGNDLVVPPQELPPPPQAAKSPAVAFSPATAGGCIGWTNIPPYRCSVSPAYSSSLSTNFRSTALTMPAALGRPFPPAHLHRLIYGGTGDLVHEQDLIPADADIADHRLQPLWALFAHSSRRYSSPAVSDFGSRHRQVLWPGSLPALQPIFWQWCA